MANKDYELGYEEGERSAKFDMEFALSEYGDYSHYRAAIEALAQEADHESDPDDHAWGPVIYWPEGKHEPMHLADWLRSHIKDAD